MARYYVICCHVLWREFSYYASLSQNVITLSFLEQGLHNTPAILRDRLQSEIDSVEGEYDAVLLGYGLCCEGINGISSRNHKLAIMKGHDCITFLLGSKERYKEYFDANPGTYWYSPGWIDTGYQPGKERHDNEYKDYLDKYGEDNAGYLMEMEQQWFKAYSKAAYVDLGFGENEQYKEYTRDCAKYLKWSYDELKGDPGLVRNFLEGNWNEEDYLIVNQGQKVVASHSDAVIKTEEFGDKDG